MLHYSFISQELKEEKNWHGLQVDRNDDNTFFF